MIDLEHVDVRFTVKGGRLLQASRDVSLSIGAGEIVTVVGESGCGKSTVGKLVLGVLRPTSGTRALSMGLTSGRRVSSGANSFG